MANRKQRRASARGGDQSGESPELPLEEGGLNEGDPAQPFPDHEEEALFKMQMKGQQLILGHWKIGLSVIGTVLLGVLAFGLYEGSQEEAQQAIQAKIAGVDRKMPKENPLVTAGFSASETDANVVAQVEEGARRFEAIAESSEGSGAVTAWMRAASAWERAGNNDKAANAYASAHALGAPGVVGWSASSAHAAALAVGGDLDGAATTYRALADSAPGILAEQALISLAELYEDGGQLTASREAYVEFSTKHPESVMLDRATGGLARLGAAQ